MPGFHHTERLTFSPKSSIFASSDLRILFLMIIIPYRPDWWSAAEMVVVLEGSPLSTEQCWSCVRVTIGRLVTSLTKALLPRSPKVDERPALGRVLVVPNFFQLRMMDATVLIGIFNNTFPRSVPRYNPVSEVYRQVLGLHVLVCALACSINYGTFYREVCAFPNHDQSTEFITGGLQSG